MQASTTIAKDLVLIGGGHSHAIALKRWIMHPLPGVRVILITQVVHTPYSGMLPGYVAGWYDFDQCHIDLRLLAQAAGVQLVVDEAIALDLNQNQVYCAHHPPIAFDLLSIDIGSTPTRLSVPGAEAHTIPIKPIAQFIPYWDAIVAEVQAHPDRSLSLGIVGGGAGGVELALSAQARLQRLYRQAGESPDRLAIHLFHRGKTLLTDRQVWVRQRAQAIVERRGIHLHLMEEVSAVIPGWVQCESGLEVACQHIFWVTQASAAPWLRQSGLATDALGFIRVNDYLQSLSHPQVFAAGDIAVMVNHPRPKAGVFAVRQGFPLLTNLKRVLQSKPLQPFIPQQEFLILMGLGDRTAIASRGSWGWGPSPWLWQWKDRIDRRFMDQFTHLIPKVSQPSLPLSPSGSLDPNPGVPSTEPTMRCAGCGAKVGSGILERVLARMAQSVSRSDVLIGLDSPDDAAVIRVPPGQALVQTVDYLPALVSDPYRVGQITAHHCLNDLWAMGATPQSALAIATLPPAVPAKQAETLYHLLSGVVQVLNEVEACLVGGHTLEGTELALGLTCNGLAHPDYLLTKGNLNPGQVLILTRSIGVGLLFAADRQGQAKGRWIEGAIAAMLQSHQAAVTCLRQYRATACTDISGFGIVGHLLEMVNASGVAVELDLDSIPLLTGVEDLIYSGIVSSLYPQNLQAARAIENADQVSHLPRYPLLFDPQTAGGLLASVPETHAIACLESLRTHGYPDSQIIGRVIVAQPNRLPIRIVG